MLHDALAISTAIWKQFVKKAIMILINYMRDWPEIPKLVLSHFACNIDLKVVNALTNALQC